jgi:5-methylcytosine-specific restriction endonuclease McrA
MSNHKPCLILHPDGTPLGAITWQRAISLEIRNVGIYVIKYYENDIIRSANDEFAVPSVAVVVRKYIKSRRKVALNKRHLLVRDYMKCQYCGHTLHPKRATIDHVKPKSHFKDYKEAHTWKNVVISCSPCNSKKDARTPEQAGMKLLSIPEEPQYAAFYAVSSPYRNIPQEWEQYVRSKKKP